MTIHSNVVVVVGLILAACNAPRSNAGGSASPATSKSETAMQTTQPPKEEAVPPTAAPAPSATAWSRSFDDDALNAAPGGFSYGRTGGGRVGRWIVYGEEGAPKGAHVLAQLDTDDTDDRFPVAVLNEPVLKDVRLSVRCKMVSGRVDQACGLVARYLDENNYFVTRANALEDNIRLYAVRDGTRRQLASWKGRITPQTWHDYRLEVRGDHLEVYWDGQRVLDHHDPTFKDAGRVVWTKADSVTLFDELRAEAL